MTDPCAICQLQGAHGLHYRCDCDCHATGTRVREFTVGGPESILCFGIRRTLNYSPRTPVHWHVWWMLGPIGGSWERPRYNR